jgi:hypothetical protein
MMLKTTLIVTLEIAVGIAGAGLLLAVIVPPLIGHHVITPGDLAGSVLIGTVVMAAICAMVFRPGGAMRQRGKHH